jgi:DNA-binding IclR family transcriptional regulator
VAGYRNTAAKQCLVLPDRLKCVGWEAGGVSEDYPVGALKVAHDVIELLVDRGPTGVTAVAEALDLPKSTAYDHLRTLDAVGYAVNEDGVYRASTKLFHAGRRARDDHELYVHGRDEALALDRNTAEGRHVQLVVAEHGQGALLFATRWRRERRTGQPVRAYPMRVGLHTNAPGKAILAEHPDDRVATLLDGGLGASTDRTVTDPAALRAELERVRDQGYATDDEELIRGMRGVAAPIVTDRGVRGAVAVYGSADRMPAAPDADLADPVRGAARTIEANIIFG